MNRQCIRWSKGKLFANYRKVLLTVIISGFAASICIYNYRPITQRNSVNPLLLWSDSDTRHVVGRDRECAEPKWNQVQDPFPALRMDAPCRFLDRVRLLNEALIQIRSQIIKKEWTSNDTGNHSVQEKIKIVGAHNDNYLHQLANFSQVIIVTLPWYEQSHPKRQWSSCDDTYNLVIQDYYQWTADDNLCNLIRKPGMTGHGYDVIYNRTCITEVNRTIQKQSLNVLALNAKPTDRSKSSEPGYPLHYYDTPPQNALHFHIIRDGIVTPNSVVYSGNLKLVQLGCRYRVFLNGGKAPGNVSNIPQYEEIFPISQYWGSGFFHRMIENMPRFAPFVDFLRRNPQIKILVFNRNGQMRDVLNIFGLNKTEMISGVCRAKVIYLPRSVMCGFAGVQETQIASSFFRNYIQLNLRPEKRNKVILIRRSGSRKFKYHALIEEALGNATLDYKLDFVVFKDNPLPPLRETMRLFYSAVLVVAPHGAGLSNVIFSQPGTFVIEGVCHPPVVNLCYLRLSHILGHHWHGHLSGIGCERVVNVSVEAIMPTVKQHLQFITNNGSLEKSQCLRH